MNLSLLNQPYPFSASSRKHVIQSLLFGLFIFLFLIIFQPFGIMSYENDYKVLQIAGYGVITTIAMLASHFLFKMIFVKWYNKESWTTGKNILYILWMFFLIGFCNCVYSVYLGFWNMSFQSFLTFQFSAILVGVFPVTISSFIVYNRRLKEALKEARELNENIHSGKKEVEKQMVLIPSQNKSESMTVELGHLLYIKSVENYVEVCLTGKKVILRNSLKAVENALTNHPQLMRCHRGYLVNLQKISSFSGNAQGLSLRLHEPDHEEIPVSRSFVPQIKAAL